MSFQQRLAIIEEIERIRSSRVLCFLTSLRPNVVANISEDSVLATAAVEELFFRGALLGLLAARWPFLRANLVQALLFLAIHVPWWMLGGVSATGIAQRTLYIAAFGLALGYLRRCTGGIVAPVLVHWANNLGGRL